MDQEQKPPSFLDDPDFDAQFSALDQGMRRPARRADEQTRPPAPNSPVPAAAAPAKPSPPGGPLPPRSIFPESALTHTPPSRFSRATDPPNPAGPATVELPAPTADRPRPLLELFPPPPIPERQAAVYRGPAIADSTSPRATRGRSPSKPEAAVPGAPTYESFYGLSEKPFTLATDPRFIYHSASHDRVLQELIAAIGRGEGVMVLTGELGTGRTTLCRSLVEQLDRRATTCFVTQPVSSFEDLLKGALVAFGVIARDEMTRGRAAVATRQELVGAITDFSASLGPTHGPALIVVDDAQNVAADVLEPLAPIAAAGEPRVQVLLVGAPALTSLLAQPDLQALQRSVSVRCRLEPLMAEETAGYVAHRLAIAGAQSRVTFDAGACAALHAITAGIPRQINLVCDRALAIGFAASAKVITDTLVTRAASDLDLVATEAEPSGALRKAVIVLVVVASLLAGAGVAAWVFRSDLARLLQLWRG